MYFNWSSGKDSALALYHIQRENKFVVDQMVTSINAHHNRVSMHGLRKELLIKQLESIGIPYSFIELPELPSMEDYSRILLQKVETLKAQGFTDTAFGDINLEDLRSYREEQLSAHGITAHFPLWKRDTRAIIDEFLSLGFKSIVVSCHADLLDESFVGRVIDDSFLNDLPPNVDPCGENGEFHTFCFDGPIFNHPIEFTIGEKILRTYPRPNAKENESNEIGFWFCDLLPKE